MLPNQTQVHSPVHSKANLFEVLQTRGHGHRSGVVFLSQGRPCRVLLGFKTLNPEEMGDFLVKIHIDKMDSKLRKI